LKGCTSASTSFRNVIVHHYDKIDESIVITILKKHLDDFSAFKNAILTILGKNA